MKEVFKDIPNYEGLYQISNLGRLKSLKFNKERILKPTLNGRGYYTVTLYKDFKKQVIYVHQLVCVTFLNHKMNGYELVVNHINLNKEDNRLENLELVTQRENANGKHIKSSSKYVGVSWRKDNCKWESSIKIKDKKVHLGFFINEYDAHLAYQRKLKEILTNQIPKTK